jgi:hypothetical protein
MEDKEHVLKMVILMQLLVYSLVVVVVEEVKIIQLWGLLEGLQN